MINHTTWRPKYGLEDNEGRQLGCCVVFCRSLVAPLRFCMRRNVFVLSFWEYLRYCEWGPTSGEIVCLSFDPWRRPPSREAFAQATASGLLSKRSSAGSTPPPRSSHASPAASLSCFPPPAVSFFLLIEPFFAASSIISAMPVQLSLNTSAATVAAARPVSIASAILAGILSQPPPAMVLHVSLSVSSTVPTSAMASSVPAFSMVSFFVSVLVFLSPAAVCQSTPEPGIFYHQWPAPEPLASNGSPQGQVIALLRERFARHDTELAKLHASLIVCMNRVSELVSSSSAAASIEAKLCS